MRLLARGILVTVGLFVGLVAATLVTKSRMTTVESAGPPASQADLQMKEIALEEQSGTVRWRLTAEQALVFDQEKRTSLRRIAVDVHDKERSWTIVGDEGEVREPVPRVRHLEIRNNVVVTSSDGLRLETSVLRWRSDEKRLWTDAPVTLSRENAVIHGTGFELLTADEWAVVTGRVHATFTPGRAK